MAMIWAISDLHLSSDGSKPMDVFGERWTNHAGRIAAAWDAAVAPADVVLLPGDFCWAMKPPAAAGDFAWLAARPGAKVLIKGNHDYWWPHSRSRLAALLPPRTWALKKTACLLGGLGIFGVRGGDFAPLIRHGDQRSAEEVAGTLERELRELAASIADLAALEAAAGAPATLRVCLCHYPPLPPGRADRRFADLIRDAGARHCVYGHLHGPESRADLVDGVLDGVDYRCVSCDLVGFRPVAITPCP
jgi:hypothetical protein